MSKMFYILPIAIFILTTLLIYNNEKKTPKINTELKQIK